MPSGSAPQPPRLAPSDATILAALLMQQRRSAALSDVVAAMDFLQHALPTFDELSYGLARLEAAGLVEVVVAADAIALVPTAASAAIGAAAATHRDSLAYLRDIETRIGVARGAPADITRGRLAGFDAADLERAVTAYRSSLRSPRRSRGGA